MKRYSKDLARSLGFIVYGIAQTYDENLDYVMEEVFRIINAVPNPAGLFKEEWLKDE